MENALEIRGLGKEFKLYSNPYHRILNLFSSQNKYQSFWALKDISLDVPKGSVLGIVGENGAGKSTLLKVLTGTTCPTRGSFITHGRVSSLLELGAGFQPNFSGRKNIYVNAAMLGFSSKDMASKIDEIIEFSGLGDFIDAPLRTYSSGMACRLGFSIAIMVDPDILILDEVMAVGDMDFQKKCTEKIYEFKDRGKTMLFCSHGLYHIRQLCDKAIWIHKGRLRAHDDAVTITNDYATYEQDLAGKEEMTLQNLPGEDQRKIKKNDDHPYVTKAWLEDPRTGKPRYEVAPGDPVRVGIEFKNQKEPVDLCIGVGFTRTDNTLCFAHTTEMDNYKINAREGRVNLNLPGINLLSGEFIIFVYLLDARGLHRYHEMLCDKNLIVKNRTKDVGLFLQEHTWDIEV